MKRIIFFTVCIVLLIVIANLSKSIYELYHKKDVLVSTEKKLTKVQNENKELKDKLVEVQDPGFVEQEARNKLFLSKPGESSILIASPTPTDMAQLVDDIKPHWQEWWDLFFGQ